MKPPTKILLLPPRRLTRRKNAVVLSEAFLKNLAVPAIAPMRTISPQNRTVANSHLREFSENREWRAPCSGEAVADHNRITVNLHQQPAAKR